MGGESCSILEFPDVVIKFKTEGGDDSWIIKDRKGQGKKGAVQRMLRRLAFIAIVIRAGLLLRAAMILAARQD
jgi:hypothetical protein